MASTVRIAGSLPAAGASPTTSLVFAGGWAVQYDWTSPDRAHATGQPTPLHALGLPAPFHRDLVGMLRGQAGYAPYAYAFRRGDYVRVHATSLAQDQPARTIAEPWGLPRHWTSVDAVFPGGGKKSGFAYFFRGDEYCRFDWALDRVSDGYPKKIAPNFHLAPPFTDNFDGVVVGHESFATKAYLFKTITTTVDRDGHAVAPGTTGSFTVRTPAYARYDFDAEASEGVVTDAEEVVRLWPGLFPLLDAGVAADEATRQCRAAILALGTPTSVAASTALAHHFTTGTPSAADLATIVARLSAVMGRLGAIPDRFQWTSGLAFAAQTTPGTLLEIGDHFSVRHGPLGRAAVLIHEAVHFTHTGGSSVDIPEWSGATINGTTFGIDAISGRAYASLTMSESLTNPSSYASLAQELTSGTDTRFGDARRHE